MKLVEEDWWWSKHRQKRLGGKNDYCTVIRIMRKRVWCVPSCSYRRAMIITKKLCCFMCGHKRKSNPKWKGSFNITYSRKRRVLFISQTVVRRRWQYDIEID